MPAYVINLQRILGLQRISYSSRNGLRLGSLVTVQTLETHPVIRQRYPVLAAGATSDVRGSATYQRAIVGVLTQRTLERAIGMARGEGTSFQALWRLAVQTAF